MKKITAVVLLLIMIFSFASCGKEKSGKYCYNCGESVSKNDSFCPSCGTDVRNIEDGSAKTTVQITTEATTVHEHVFSKNITPPTCTEKGFTTYTCACGESYEDDFKDPQHSYENYICTRCDATDKAHAYEFMVNWVKKNGEVKDGVLGHYYYDSKYDTTYGLCYNESKNRLYVQITDYQTHFELDLKPVNGKFSFYDRYESTWDYEARGKIDGKTYVKEGYVSFDEYDGPSDKIDSFKKHATLSVSSAIIYLRIVMLEEIGGADFFSDDMGFIVFES